MSLPYFSSRRSLIPFATLLVLFGCAGNDRLVVPDAGSDVPADVAIDTVDDTQPDTVEPPDAGVDVPAECPEGCDDGIACTNDSCEAGECVNAGTDEGCGPEEMCVVGIGCAPRTCTDDAHCDDSLVCNGTETCLPEAALANERGCVLGELPACDDGVECTTDACDEATGGCVATVDHTVCGNEVFCDGVEVCDAVTGCIPGPLPVCDDGVACTNDSCDAATDACTAAPDNSRCVDADLCDGAEVCDAVMGCQEGTAVDCTDALSCTVDTCVVGGMCQHVGTDMDTDGFVVEGCGTGDDCNDEDEDIHPGAAEVCDGVDNNCSGSADDATGMECISGSAPVACTTSCLTAGARACDAGCMLGACVAPTETCNGCDDNGNGVSDDGFACERGAVVPCTTGCGTAGTQMCAGDCSGFGACRAPAEVCGNGCDDDGNGIPEDGCGINQGCGGATILTGTSGTLSDTYAAASRTVTDCGFGGELWYQITLTDRKVLYLDTFGSDFDTRISLRNSCGVAATVCEDDDCGLRQEQMARVLNPGTYFIAVHAFSSGTTTGSIQLRWQTISAGNGAYTAVTTNGTVTGTTSGTGILSTSCGGTGPEDGWFFATCPSVTRTVTASTCGGAAFDTVVSVIRPDDLVLACNDDACGLQSSVTATVTGPGLNVIMMDGLGGGAGAYQLTISGL